MARHVLDRPEGADGGARRDRTDDLMLAKHALYQLSYGPFSRPRRFEGQAKSSSRDCLRVTFRDTSEGEAGW